MTAGRPAPSIRNIWCVPCNATVAATPVTGHEVYPHRDDLMAKPYWRCPSCHNHVGCHSHSTRPLGVIPSRELRAVRSRIHDLIDPIWRSHRMSRSEVYSRLSEVLGREYHTADLRSLYEASLVYREAQAIERESMKA